SNGKRNGLVGTGRLSSSRLGARREQSSRRTPRLGLFFGVLVRVRAGPRQGAGAVFGLDQGSLRLAAGVDPNHGHLAIRFVNESVRLGHGHEGGVIAGELIAVSLHQTQGTSLHDGDGFVVVVEVAGQGSAGFKAAVAAADSYGAQAPLK